METKLNPNAIAESTIPITKIVSIDLEGKQDTLVSGTNIKTINGESLLGMGNIEISGNSSVDPKLLDGFIPLSRDFSDDFNNDFAR